MFQLHPRLDENTVEICTLDICRVLLLKDSRFPWVILVPEKSGLRDLHDLRDSDHTLVMAEIRLVSKKMAELFNAQKMNVAALGNMVPQLHIHIIARFESDAAWPAPVWGIGDAIPYDTDALTKICESLRIACEKKQA